MTVTLDLKPEVEERIAAEAKARGLSVEQYIQQAITAPGTLDMLAASIDPLTGVLSPGAFHSLLGRIEANAVAEVDGCVVLIDIDRLSMIYSLDYFLGDVVIRAVASAIRSLIGKDDMLFRLSGDEFLALMFKLPEEEVARRMHSLNDLLEEHTSHVKISVSTAVSRFVSLKELPDVIERANRSIHNKRKTARKSVPPDPNSLPIHEWLRKWNEWLSSHDYIKAPPLSDEAISRESIYREREDNQL